MKLDKSVVQRRLDLMTAEGIVYFPLAFQNGCPYIDTLCFQTFVPSAHVGVDFDAADIRAEHDAVVICTGATWPRDLKIPNRDVDGIHFAMEYLQVWQIKCHALECSSDLYS